MGKFFSFVIGLCAVCLITYGMYWLFKTISYEIFYESMVQETIREMVKPEYLKI
jgi:hypothetical protein